MKKSFPAALVCAAALLIPSTAYACPTDCSTSGGDSSTRLDVKDHASTQVDTDAARKEVDRARSFLDAGADLSQSERDCFLSKVLEGSSYDKDSRTVRTDVSERVSEDVESSQSDTYDASQLARWLYEHEDTWQGLFEDYEVGDVLSFSTQSVTSQTSRGSAEFFASIEVVAVYVGDGKVVYCADNGTDTQVKETSIATLKAELNVTVSLVSRPCGLNTSSAAPSAAPSESAADQSCRHTCQSENSQSSSESSDVTDETSQSSSASTSSESTESSSTTSNESSRSSSDVSESTSASSSSQSSTSSASESSRPSSDTSSAETSSESSDSSVSAPQQSSSTTAPSSSSTPTKSSSRPSSLPRTGAGAVLPIASVAVIAAAAGGSILARRRSRV